MSKNQNDSNKKEEELVITPCGPKPKDQVHSVRPGETVRKNKDGTYSVVPEEKARQERKEDDNA